MLKSVFWQILVSVCLVLLALSQDSSVSAEKRAVEVTGLVVDPVGAVIARAAVSFQGQSEDIVTQTTADGIVRHQMRPGRYFVVINSPGFVPAEFNLQVTAPGPVSFNASLQLRQIGGDEFPPDSAVVPTVQSLLTSDLPHDTETCKTWDSLYASYKKYGSADDGYVAEGYSESAARILVDHWTTLPRLVRLTKKDSVFLSFVLRHVDSTLDTRDLVMIRRKATAQCPKGAHSLCGEIADRANAAIKEAGLAESPR